MGAKFDFAARVYGAKFQNRRREMTAKNEREIYDGCSRPRLSPLDTDEVDREADARRREVASRVGSMVDWGKMYDHRREGNESSSSV